jgi:uncharacterized protein YutE (UPF0331/DUF86 family)
MPDIDIIENRLSSFLEDLNNLTTHKDVTIDDVKRDKDLLWILERGIYLLIQNLFDILAHIVAADFDEKWDYYTDISEILLKHNIISEEEQNTLNKMAGFRNRLSHEYLSLDVEVLVDVVNNRIPDFTKFLVIIKNYCKI